MKRRLPGYWALTALIVLAAFPRAASADVASHVVISEMETATSTSASQEFIELYNPTGAAVPLSGWTIEYKSASAADTASSWSKKATLTGSIAAHGFYLIAPKGYLAAADSDWTATLAGSGGTVRVKDGAGTVVDKLGYGTGTVGAEGMPPAAPPAGQSLERLPGRLDELAGNGVDTDNNSADFVLRTGPNPQSTASPLESPDTDMSGDDTSVVVSPDPTPITNAGDAPAPSSYAPIEITEILPNPMAPQTDSHDEYIELYNPTANSVDLKGYSLRTGSNFHDYYVLPDVQIAASAYTVLYASQTGLAMPNTGGAVELLDPSGAMVDQTPTYSAAPDGQAWAYFDSGWAWTLQLTPGQPNVLAALALPVAPAKVSKPKASVKKIMAAAKKAKTTTKKATKPRKVGKPKTSSFVPQLAAERNMQPANWLIIVLATLTISYAIYEFRHDITRIYHRFRGHEAAGSTSRASSEGGRDD